MKYFDLKNWNFFRVIRLVFAVIAFAAFYNTNEILYAVIGGLLIIQVLLNTGCGVGSCYNYTRKNNANKQSNDISYEEIN